MFHKSPRVRETCLLELVSSLTIQASPQCLWEGLYPRARQFLSRLFLPEVQTEFLIGVFSPRMCQNVFQYQGPRKVLVSVLSCCKNAPKRHPTHKEERKPCGLPGPHNSTTHQEFARVFSVLFT